MFGRNRGVLLAKPKKLHSLEYLKYLYSVIQKNVHVTAQNCETVVEALRLVAEILIWGDQNDSTVMDLFLEKNMLEYFLQYLKQNPGRTVCIQLLQTLNIMFENITNQTAVYYLLSNNHTNDIITHRFDFSDEEVVAYYVSFLKTLSLRLNSKTINFFYLEQRREFDLYVESIKLFCHPENMVRIAVRTITLNVHKVKDEGSLEFIHHQTALPYFSHLVWSIGNTILDMGVSVSLDMDGKNQSKVEHIVAEHIDHLHYLNDLLSLNIEGLNEVLCDQLLHRLFIPLHLYSLTRRTRPSSTDSAKSPSSPRVTRPCVSHTVALFVLTHTFSILHHTSLMSLLTEAIALGDPSLTGLMPTAKLRYGRDRESTSSLPGRLKNSGSDATSVDDVDDDSLTDPNHEPSVGIAKALISASVAMRSAAQVDVGHRLSAYLSERQVGPGADCMITFTQPCESLEAGLRRARKVTPALMLKLWPTNMAPLLLTDRQSTFPLKQLNSKEKVTAQTQAEDTSSADQSANPQSTRTHSASPSEVVPQNPTTSSTPTPHAFVEISPTQGTKITSPATDSMSRQTEGRSSFHLKGRPFLRAVFRALESGPSSDYECLFAMLFLLSIRSNTGVDSATWDLVRMTECPSPSTRYDNLLVDRLLTIVADACRAGNKIRLVTLRIAVQLITDLIWDGEKGVCSLCDAHVARLLGAREDAMMTLRSYFRTDAVFLDLFEQELRHLQRPPVNPVQVGMDYAILIPPSASPLFQPTATQSCDSGTASSSSKHTKRALSSSAHSAAWCRDPSRRLPETEIEHIHRAVSVYVLVHTWTEALLQHQAGENLRMARNSHSRSSSHHIQPGTKSPVQALLSNSLCIDMSSLSGFVGLANIPDLKHNNGLSLKVGERLDLSSETLIGCTVERDGTHEKRYLITHSQHLVLVEPDSRQLGWGVITFVGPLQDLEANCDIADSRCLHVTIQHHGYLAVQALSIFAARTSTAGSSQSYSSKPALLVARFLFEDHIRCMTARQLLLRGRDSVRQGKLLKIASLLDFSLHFMRENFFTGIDLSSVNSVTTGFGYSLTPNSNTVKPFRNLSSSAAGGGGAAGSQWQQRRAPSDLNSNGDLSGPLRKTPTDVLRRPHRGLAGSPTETTVPRSTKSSDQVDVRFPMVSLTKQPQLTGSSSVVITSPTGGYDLSDGHSPPFLRLACPREPPIELRHHNPSVQSDPIRAGIGIEPSTVVLSHSSSAGHLGATNVVENVNKQRP